jgi:serine/threonine-protein kinase
MLDFKTVTPLADLYATAATLYYMLTCKYVYDETTGGGDLIRMLLEESPIPIRERRPDVPRGLADVISKCLARDPKERYPDAATMRSAIKPFC